ncbi:MAG: 23S rRNA (pseudouridine(1915)-N(3))-methyltransferase RlmH [Tissierellia bacterium]|nr:23S rRNA (pseudouridine(1915)-N(3))-methyltransferase RlmH [Tissierellia bacterium]
MNINLVAVGNIKEKYFIDAINEYKKRLSSYANLKIWEISEYKLPNNPGDSKIFEGLEKEGELILNKIPEKSFVIALCVEGKGFSSEEFSDKISECMINGYSDISFVIGGSYGLSEKVKSTANLRLSFSKMTFPHQLMRVILLEQVYRGFRILKNEPYHK